MKDTILIERPEPGLACIKFNRPHTGNAYDDEFVCTLITALDDLAEDETLKVVWITAEGEHFCKGPDASWQKRRYRSGRAEHQLDAEQMSRLFQTLYEFPTPVIATVRGQANASAVGLLCCCDIVIACERASFTIPETQFGQVPALQSPYLIKTLGERAARYYALTAETIDAYTATRLGLVHKLAPREEIQTLSSLLVEKLMQRPSAALRQTKAMLSIASNEPFDEALVETLVDASTDIRVMQSRQKSNMPA